MLTTLSLHTRDIAGIFVCTFISFPRQSKAPAATPRNSNHKSLPCALSRLQPCHTSGDESIMHKSQEILTTASRVSLLNLMANQPQQQQQQQQMSDSVSQCTLTKCSDSGSRLKLWTSCNCSWVCLLSHVTLQAWIWTSPMASCYCRAICPCSLLQFEITETLTRLFERESWWMNTVMITGREWTCRDPSYLFQHRFSCTSGPF